MAEGGDEFSLKDTDLGKLLDEKDDNDDEQEDNRTRPSQPGAPYHRGEQIEMKT